MMIPDLRILEDLSEVAAAIAAKGWGEANAGNVSYRLSELELVEVESQPRNVLLGRSHPMIEGRAFLVSRTGSRFRDIALRPRRNMLLIDVVPQGYRILAGEGKPTFELPSHLAIHNALLTNRPEDKAVVHTHPTALVAYSHLPMADHIGALMRMAPESFHHFPERVHFIPYELPGTTALAERTVAALEKTRAAVWRRHGAIATGENFSRALDPLEVLDKVAELYLRVSAAAGCVPTGVGMTDDEARATAMAMGAQDIDLDRPERD